MKRTKQQNQIVAELEQVGLSEIEAQVYALLLSSEPKTIQEVTQMSALARSSVAMVLGKLYEEGVIKFTLKGKRKFYYVHDPEALLTMISIRRNALAEQEAAIKKNLPKLRSQHYAERGELIHVEHFKGEAGFKKLFMKSLDQKKGSEVLRLSIENENFNVARAYLHNTYVPTKLENKITTRLILSDSPGARDVQARDSRALRETRILGKNLFDPLCYVAIWGDNVSYTVWDDGLDSILITSSSVATTMRQIFEIMWVQAKK